VLQDAAVTVVVSLTWGVDTNGCIELNLFAGLLGCGDLQSLWRGAVVHLLIAFDVEGLVAVKAEGLVGLALWEQKRKKDHNDEVGTLGSPVTGRTGTVFHTTENNQRDASFLVVHRRIVDEGLWSIFLGEVQGVATGDVNKLVSQTDVSESTANHDLVVTTTGTQGVVVNAVYAVGIQVLSSRGAWLNRGSRGDV